MFVRGMMTVLVSNLSAVQLCVAMPVTYSVELVLCRTYRTSAELILHTKLYTDGCSSTTV